MNRPMSDIEKRVREFEADIQSQADAVPKDELWERVQALVGGGAAQPPIELKLDTYQKNAIYNNVVEIVKAGGSPSDIATQVVLYLEQKINEVNNDAKIGGENSTVRSKPLNSPIFRRSE